MVLSGWRSPKASRSFSSQSHRSKWKQIMRSWIIAALAAITLFHIAASLSAHAISTRTHAFRSAAIKLKEQGYFPLCSLPFERLLPVNPDRFVLIKICT
jgi:hypothetical protein